MNSFLNIAFILSIYHVRCHDETTAGNCSSSSNCLQDVFVHNLLAFDNSTSKTFIEVLGKTSSSASCGYGSNTIMLEKCGWVGYIVLSSHSGASMPSCTRNAQFVNNLNELFTIMRPSSANMPRQIDYLSFAFEIYKENANLFWLFFEYKFKIVTLSFERSVESKLIQLKFQEIMRNEGYELIASNVIVNHNVLDDWYVNPSLLPQSIYRLASTYRTDGLNCREIISIAKDYLSNDVIHNFGTRAQSNLMYASPNIYNEVYEYCFSNDVTPPSTDWLPPTDLQDYLEGIQEYCNSSEAFKYFRVDERYVFVVEHGTAQQAAQQLDVAYRYHNAIFQDVTALEVLHEGNIIGSPRLHVLNSEIFPTKYNPLQISSSYARYFKVAAEIESLFGITHYSRHAAGSQYRVAEIGVGFGGQAHVLWARGWVDTYTLFDLPAVLGLASKYLSQIPWIPSHRVLLSMSLRDMCPEGGEEIDWGGSGSITVNYGNRITKECIAGKCDETAASNTNGSTNTATTKQLQDKYDLCISNYAISELHARDQDRYLALVLSRCTCGYVTYNALGMGAYTIAQFVHKLHKVNRNKVTVRLENPSTDPRNRLIIWGTLPP